MVEVACVISYDIDVSLDGLVVYLGVYSFYFFNFYFFYKTFSRCWFCRPVCDLYLVRLSVVLLAEVFHFIYRHNNQNRLQL